MIPSPHRRAAPGRRDLLLVVFFVALLVVPPLAADTASEREEATAAPELGPTSESPNNPSLATGEPPAGVPTADDLPPARFPDELRTFDGRGNNGRHPDWGAAGSAMLRRAGSRYADGVGQPAGAERKSGRAVSNDCSAQHDDRPNSVRATSFLWQWGQFLDHDITLAPIADPHERFDIEIPGGDHWFDPEGDGDRTMAFERSAYRMVDGVRQQVNVLTAYVDASQVYGSAAERAAALRAGDGSGRLATSEGDLLPRNVAGLANAPSTAPGFFLAGDVRANEQTGLLALHTLFVREHNFWADTLRAAAPEADGETIYQQARAIVAAEIQAITYREFLPLLLGPGALARYRGYDPAIDAGIANEFATAAFRVGHTLLPDVLLRLDAAGEPIAGGHLELAQAFFRPEIVVEHGIEPILRGLVAQPAQEVDPFVVDAVRNLLFGPPGAGGFDLAALNLQRGRDHGLPSYNDVREAYGLRRRLSISDITPDLEIRKGLRAAYEAIDHVDLWLGGLAEPHVPGAMVGETFFAILVDQFERLRDGDRFWYRSYLPPDWVETVERQTLAEIIRRNTTIGRELPPDVFRGDLLRWKPRAKPELPTPNPRPTGADTGTSG